MAKQYTLQQKCLNTMVQLSTPTPNLSPQTSHPQNLPTQYEDECIHYMVYSHNA